MLFIRVSAFSSAGIRLYFLAENFREDLASYAVWGAERPAGKRISSIFGINDASGKSYYIHRVHGA